MYDASVARIRTSVNESASAQKELENLEDQVRSLEATLRQAILNHRAAKSKELLDDKSHAKPAAPADPSTDKLAPIIEWRFDDATNNPRVNAASRLSLVGLSKIEDGTLRVGQDSYAVSQPITKPLKEKTLSVLVQLDNLKQRSGGAITVQSADGSVFDSIVFGEQAPQQWLAGSNVFARTKSFQGPQEEEANSTPVHFAIAYDRDGTIRGYRNGKLYGQAYQSAGLHEYAANQTVVTLGLRHLPAGGNRSLSGRIYLAQVFDRALSAEEIAAIASDVEYVSGQEILDTMTEKQQHDWKQWKSQIVQARQRLQAARSNLPSASSEAFSVQTDADIQRLALSQVARTIFTLKEFIYVP